MDPSLKTQTIAFAVRLIADNTNLIRKPDGFETLFNGLFAPQESYDIRIARNVEAEAARVIDGIKKVRTRRKFEKIIQNY